MSALGRECQFAAYESSRSAAVVVTAMVASHSTCRWETGSEVLRTSDTVKCQCPVSATAVVGAPDSIGES